MKLRKWTVEVEKVIENYTGGMNISATLEMIAFNMIDRYVFTNENVPQTDNIPKQKYHGDYFDQATYIGMYYETPDALASCLIRYMKGRYDVGVEKVVIDVIHDNEEFTNRDERIFEREGEEVFHPIWLVRFKIGSLWYKYIFDPVFYEDCL